MSTGSLPYADIPGFHAARKGGALAVSDGLTQLSWQELDLRTNRAARALRNAGVKPDDLVTVALPNGTDFIEACFAIWKAGATPQPVSSRLPRLEIDAIIALARTPLVIGEEGLSVSRRVVTYAALLAGSPDDSRLPLHIARHFKAPTSGGSTGRPKLILDARPALSDPGSAAGWRTFEHTVALMPGPLYHNGPFVTAFNALAAGAQVIVMARYSNEDVLRLIAEHKATWLYLVPTMMSRIYRLPQAVKDRYDLSSLETVWHLAAPCPAWLKEAWINWLGPDVIWELYAASEGMSGTVINGTEWLTHRGSVGRVFTGEIRILDESGRDAPPGEIGEIFMRPSGGAATFQYVGAEARQIEGGWQSLGDMGHFDEEGYLYLADRRSDMILVGGSNIYPAEIESAIEAHPHVRSCAVIGLPDDDLGARIHAIVQPDGQLTADDLEHHLAAYLAPYKVPRSYEFVETPLRDTAGKVRRSQLREARLASTR